MSSSTSPTDWFHHFCSPAAAAADNSSPPSNAAIVPSTTIAANPANTSSAMGPGGSDQFLNAISGRSGQESRVSRPTRRRSRASRKNPTTLLNTDTTNFRAMVQRYTGGSAASMGGELHQGQMGNFNALHAPLTGVDQRTSQLHQQLLMQQQGFASTATTSASSVSPVDPRASGWSDQLYSFSLGDENKRGDGGGFMF